MKSLRIILSLAAILSFGVIATLPPGTAKAAYCDSGNRGRAGCQGYFTGQYSSATFGTVFNVLSGGLYASSASTFISVVESNLSSSGQNSVGAAFIIANMMGKSGTSFTSTSGGVTYARSVLTQWEDLVNQYAAAGRIQWAKVITTSSTYTNSAWFSDINDDAFHQKGQETISVIRFTAPSGGTFDIERNCGNLIGALSSLPLLKVTVSPRMSASPGVATVGQAVTFQSGRNVSGYSPPSPGSVNYTLKLSKNGGAYSNVSSGTFSINSNGIVNLGTIPYTIAAGDTKICAQMLITSNPNPAIVSISGNPASACVTVNSPPPPGATTWIPSTQATPTSFEKGTNSTISFWHHISPSQPFCDWSKPAGPNPILLSSYPSGTPIYTFQRVDSPTKPVIPGILVTGPLYHPDGVKYWFVYDVLQYATPILEPSVTWSYSGDDGSGSFTYARYNCYGNIGTDSVWGSPVNMRDYDNFPPGPAAQSTTFASGLSAGASSRVYEIPYARFYGNDVVAASASACGGTNGTLFFNENLYSPATAASGSQYAAIAQCLLSGAISLNSAVFRTTAPSPPNQLKSQGNSVSNNRSVDLLNDLPPRTASTFNNGSDWLTSGFYDLGNLPGATATVSKTGVTKKITVRAHDIIINANIINSMPAGTFNDKTAPVVLLIADGGNIYIDRGVRQIDAILMAPSGKIITCASGTTEIPASSRSSACRNKLTINGAVGAKAINFTRSIGTRLLAPSNEDNGVAGMTMGGVPGGADQASEVINFPSYLYFATPYLKDTSADGFQAIYSPPPQL